jgi:S-formylglutathione hydrolase FrmB
MFGRHTKENYMREWLRVSLLGLMVLTSCSSREGTLIVRTIEAPSLAQNRMGIADRQQLAIYLPPSYREGERRYPVLYWLPNFTACLWRYTGGSYQGFHLRQTLDELIAKGAAREMIVVIPNAVHMLGGSCFRNSPLTGNWEDYIVKDVVAYMDSQFRTIRSAGARGLTGHGMGGSGALEIGLKHPDLFSGVYAMSPALFDTNGLRDAGMLSDRQGFSRLYSGSSQQSLARTVSRGVVRFLRGGGGAGPGPALSAHCLSGGGRSRPRGDSADRAF